MPKQIIKDLLEIGIIDVIGDPISIQDVDFKILYQNQRHRDIVGDQTGKYCYSAYQGRDSICEGCHLEMAFKDGKVHIVERSRATENGISYSENIASPLKNSDNKIIAGIEIVRDITKRKLMEEQLEQSVTVLERNVSKRTAELIESNKALLVEINTRKKTEENLRFTEKEMVMHLNELKEANITLKVLLEHREKDKIEFENNILANVKHLIKPYIAKLKNNNKNNDELTYLGIIESNLNELVSPFSFNLHGKFFNLTPRELQMADLIKDGKQDKDLTDILNISLDTVKTHRKNIRKKLGIYGNRTNLRTYLLSIADNR